MRYPLDFFRALQVGLFVLSSDASSKWYFRTETTFLMLSLESTKTRKSKNFQALSVLSFLRNLHYPDDKNALTGRRIASSRCFLVLRDGSQMIKVYMAMASSRYRIKEFSN